MRTKTGHYAFGSSMFLSLPWAEGEESPYSPQLILPDSGLHAFPVQIYHSE